MEIKIKIVPDKQIACPHCGAYWGNPDPKLDFPNRFKVDDWCRCYNPECPVEWYQPSTGETEPAREDMIDVGESHALMDKYGVGEYPL